MITVSANPTLDLGRREFVIDGIFKRDVFLPAVHDGAEGLLVDVAPKTRISPHFHQVDQFQVVVGGTGLLGKHALVPGTVHYTDAYSPYGPIRAGVKGLLFFTLRDERDPGGYVVPENRDKLIRPARRNLSDQVKLAEPEGLLTAPRQGALLTLREDTDGLAVRVAVIPPNVEMGFRFPMGGGRFGIILVGAMRWESELLPRWSGLYVKAGEEHVCVAGPNGLQILLLDFPVSTVV
jgi:hypothetical protein